MPHAVDSPDDLDAHDDLLIQGLLNPDPNRNENADLLDESRPLGTAALDDAEDFADIGDDDLPEEEFLDSPGHVDAANGLNGHIDAPPAADGDAAGGPDFDDLFGEGADGEDDLFGEAPAVQHANGTNGHTSPPTALRIPQKADKLPSVAQTAGNDSDISDAEIEEDEETQEADHDLEALETKAHKETPEEREQRLLFEQHRRGHQIREQRVKHGIVDDEIPAPPETDAELLHAIWPGYSKDEVPRWNTLFPGKRAYYVYKAPLRPPKPIHPTKVNLELEPDHERIFRNTNGTHRGKRSIEEAEENGIFVVTENESSHDVSDGAFGNDTLDDEEMIGGLSVGDLRILCEDWESQSQHDSQGDYSRMLVIREDDADEPAAKRQKVDATAILDLDMSNNENLPSFDDPATLTARLSRRALLEPTDPNLLIDFHPHQAKQAKTARINDNKRITTGNATKKIQARWNISKDREYDLLKENQSHRVRSMITKLEVKHSMPAQKLQYPFFKLELQENTQLSERRAFHRPGFQPASGKIFFERPHRIKRQTLKDRPVEEIYAQAKDLSMGDNSNMLLLEYSEESPMVLSNFGMNSRLINYYRRKDNDDTARPKLDIGETQVLLPQDNSPFSNFGFVDPGEMRPTIHNEMYRAPIFKHEPKATDFLLIRSTTGVDGSRWFIRNIENLHVVGQQLPYVQIPGPHSRKVTDASKTRLKMLSFRIYRKNELSGARKPWLSHDMIIKHNPDSDIPQNRSKMKEWMTYDSEQKSWVPKRGELVPDEATVRNWITPEQLCLLDATQVGQQQLADAGYANEDDDEGEKQGESVDEQMAPWKLTKNFLDACQGLGMVALHGPGDPTGRGEGYSFIKTSMKGGYRSVGESIEVTIAAQKQAELGGHKYNVAHQQRSYNEGIRRIWDAQDRSLRETIEHSEIEPSIEDQPMPKNPPAQTPRSQIGTPAGTAKSVHNDDSISQMTRNSFGVNGRNKKLKITRTWTKYGQQQTETVEIDDPRVINKYLRIRRERELKEIELEHIQPTGDPERDALAMEKLKAEYERLLRNRERRHVREKMKNRDSIGGAGTPGSPSAGGGKGPGGATQRKCANCGQVGHIKTNKKLCPMLNGQWAKEQAEKAAAGGSDVAPAGASSTQGPIGALPTF